MKNYLQFVLSNLFQVKTDEEVVDNLLKNTEFNYLRISDLSPLQNSGAEFNTDTKSATFLKDALQEPLRC